MSERYIVGVTGASGAEYALRFLWQLSFVPGQSDLIVSPNFYKVLESEAQAQSAGADLLQLATATYGPLGKDHEFVTNDYRDISARAASGSAAYRAMAILPCSMKTLAAIHAGLSQNLIERAADVSLKERRTLILCPRETPLSTVHLRNMLGLTEAGATVMPIMPGYYHRPSGLVDLYDFMTDRIFQHMGITKRTMKPWRS
ncbi:MAG TPA: UbiX family flavin prenyltransferase [Turneriella sp.]|nr:UbiX family flavin prenyltransferase [Turneriella sp.]HNL55869.1 UbiX family flavin prenyltransferase [Turneriella sp.]